MAAGKLRAVLLIRLSLRDHAEDTPPIADNELALAALVDKEKYTPPEEVPTLSDIQLAVGNAVLDLDPGFDIRDAAERVDR